jgi:hypothetical protein
MSAVNIKTENANGLADSDQSAIDAPLDSISGIQRTFAKKYEKGVQ